MKAQPFIREMIYAEAAASGVSPAVLIEGWALNHCKSPEAREVLLQHTKSDPLVMATKAAEAQLMTKHDGPSSSKLRKRVA